MEEIVNGNIKNPLTLYLSKPSIERNSFSIKVTKMNSNSNLTVPTVSRGSLAARWLGLALVVSVAAVGCARADQIDDYVTAKMHRQHIPGLSLAVVKDGKPVKVKGYGVSNLELGTPATPESIYMIGSLSK
jgi:Beta-lactamase